MKQTFSTFIIVGRVGVWSSIRNKVKITQKKILICWLFTTTVDLNLNLFFFTVNLVLMKKNFRGTILYLSQNFSIFLNSFSSHFHFVARIICSFINRDDSNIFFNEIVSKKENVEVEVEVEVEGETLFNWKMIDSAAKMSLWRNV